MSETLQKVLLLITGILMFLVPGMHSTVHAGDGDVDYSAPYITVDPETGELITVNPGPQQKMHAAPTGDEAATGRADESGAMADERPDNTGLEGPSGGAGLDSSFVLVAVVVALIFFSVAGFLIRNHGKTSDA